MLNHQPEVLNHRKFIFFSHCDTLLGSLAIVYERCKSPCFILPYDLKICVFLCLEMLVC